MEVKSVTKFARISDLKARDVARAVQGMPVSEALSVLNFTPRKAALLFGKTLRSAIANAENNHELDADDLYIKSATATKGPVLKRIMPRARGS
ncbi:MAG: 50S ribosomal protein L22, partial [Roseimicrobium sp.]